MVYKLKFFDTRILLNFFYLKIFPLNRNYNDLLITSNLYLKIVINSLEEETDMIEIKNFNLKLQLFVCGELLFLCSSTV